MADLTPCSDAPGLEAWVRQTLRPYFSGALEPLRHVPLGAMLDAIPVLLDPDDEASCVWSGYLGAVACWQLHNERGNLIARLAIAQKTDLTMPEAMVSLHPRSYHQSGIGAGPGFVAAHPFSYDHRVISEGPFFNGYIIDDDLVGVLNIGHGTRMLYVTAEFVGAAVVDYDGYWEGEALLERLQVVGTADVP